MRYHIDTIPVWDAAREDSECLLCALERRTEEGEAERYLGASVMEPDVRIRGNEKGFCKRHHGMLFGMSNRLGHALMLESHTIETRQRMEAIGKKLQAAGRSLQESGLGDRLNGKVRNATAEVLRQAAEIREMAGSCVMCETIEENMRRYLHTFFHLYQHDSDFQRRFHESKGLCLPHLGQLLEVGAEELGPRELGAFAVKAAELEQRNLDRIQEDISWFIKKFDYRFEKEDWKNSRDAVERTANKMRGYCCG